MDLPTWTAYFFASILIAISPGSGAVLAMSHGLNFGVRRAGATIAGLQTGLLVILLVAGAGVGSLLIASETAFNIVKTAGALYLLWIGLSQWRAAPVAPAPAEDAVGVAAPAGLQGTPRRLFLSGFLTNVTNPKGIVFMVAVLPQFITDSRPLAPQLAIIAVTTLGVDAVVMHGYAFAASRLQAFFRDAQAMKAQNRVFGGLLMAVGAGLFFVKRTAHASPGA
ncbi:MAG: LysE family transporter [Polaromonas sp.]|nr:LysE family transporter [Polaromonas sp.]